MRRFIKKGMAAILAAAMVITLAPANSADAAKKPKLSNTKASVTVGKTVKILLKNGKKSAKVTWATSKKKIAKISKSSTKGNKAYASIKGVKAGKAKITASYKVGKRTTKLTCTVTVKKKAVVTATPAKLATATASTKPVATATSVATKTNSPVITNTPVPTAVVTKRPPNTPGPTATPTSLPGNTSANAYKLADGTKIDVDGAVKSGDAWEDVYDDQIVNLLSNQYSVRGTKTLTAATAKLMWANDAFYVLVNVKKANAGADDSVNIYFDEDNEAKDDYTKNPNAVNFNVPVGGTAKLVSGTAACVGKAAATADGYVVEAKIPATKVAAADGTLGNFCFDIQINDGKACTINYIDSQKAMVYNKDTDKWELGDTQVQVSKDTSRMGIVNLLPSNGQATTAFYTGQGEALRTAAEISADWETVSPTVDPSASPDVTAAPQIKSKTMKFVDTKYWTDAYKAHESGSIFFANANVPSYKGNADRVTLKAKDRDSAQGYIIWDKDYAYVLFDITDPDIAPASADHYDTDSTEFFLDEDYSRNTGYCAGDNAVAGEDAVQLRVDAINNAFSANNAGTAKFDLVAHATNIKKDASDKAIGYQTEYIIKFQKEHKSGDVMGMDLQVNDCFTNVTPGSTAAPDSTATPETKTPDRAGTLTAYDTTNNAYTNPSCFGRVKLFDKDAVVVEPTAEPTTAPTAGPAGAASGSALKTGTAIVADGDIDAAWNSAAFVDMNTYSGTKGATTAKSKVMWDDTNLYALVVVTDANIDSTATADYQRDGGEIFLDEDNSREKAYADNTDAFQYRFTGFTQDASTSALTAAFQGGKGTDYSGLVSAYKVTKDTEGKVTGYVIEYKVPFKNAVKANQIVGFDISAFDCTAGKRDNEIQMFGPFRGTLYNDASIFGTLQLVEPAKYGWDASKTNYTLALNADTIKQDNAAIKVNDDGTVTVTNTAIYSGAKITLPADVTDKFSKITISYINGDGGYGHAANYGGDDVVNAWGGAMSGSGDVVANLDNTQTLKFYKFFNNSASLDSSKEGYVAGTKFAVTITKVVFSK